MAWFPYVLVLLVAYVLQTSLVRILDLPLVDLCLTLALVVSFVAPMVDARLAAWLAGLVEGLGSSGALGAYALAFGLAGLILTALRGVININAWFGRVVAAVLAAWPAQLLIDLHVRFWVGPGDRTIWEDIWHAFWVAVVAALLSATITGLPALVAARRRRFRAAT